MTTINHHELLYRRDVISTLENSTITIFGAGSLGSNIADILIRSNVSVLNVFDDDIVEDHNLGNTIYDHRSLGQPKVFALRAHAYYVNQNVVINAFNEEVSKRRERTAKAAILGSHYTIDTFDNAKSKMFLHNLILSTFPIQAIHAGMSADYAGIRWIEENKEYKVEDTVDLDVCDYPLSQNIVKLAAIVTVETIFNHIESGRMDNWLIGLRDFNIMRAS